MTRGLLVLGSLCLLSFFSNCVLSLVGLLLFSHRISLVLSLSALNLSAEGAAIESDLRAGTAGRIK